ncbi:MAG: tetratricopeptide repeat protein, partial [Bacteroidota bacterium]
MKTILKALFTISLALFSFLLPVYSSNPVIDSLENQILLHNQDEALVQTYSRLYTQYLHLDNKKAMEYAGKAFELSKKLKYPRGLANSYNNLGLGFLYQGATEKALEYFQKALTIDAEENFIKGMAPTVLNIGIIYGNMGELEKSLDYFKRYKEMAEELGVKDLSAAHTNIGVSYSQMGCFKEALEQFEIVDSIANALGKEAQIVRNLDKMALLHYNQGMYPESIEYGNKALKANDKLGSKSVLMNANRIMGGAYFKLKKEDLAIKHLEISNRVAKE